MTSEKYSPWEEMFIHAYARLISFALRARNNTAVRWITLSERRAERKASFF